MSDGRLEQVAVVGGGAREHAIGEALARNPRVQLFSVASCANPGLTQLSEGRYTPLPETDATAISAWAAGNNIDLVFVGSEDPLAAGLPDELAKRGIRCVGPIRQAAQLETSKLFTRQLMERHGIPGGVEFRYFSDPDALAGFLSASDREYALKPVGLTAGKGVKVMGVHFDTVKEAVDYGRHIIESAMGGTPGIVVEERLVGEEFTLQAFVDGETVLPMPLVQDYKRAFENDLGPNTGSMGSYSREDGNLAFLGPAEREQAVAVLHGLVEALRSEGATYKGIMYGQFMMTAGGVRLVEINARFGDPEALNVLTLLEDDLLEISHAICAGGLKDLKPRFRRQATVCKYVTPPGYGFEARSGEPLRLNLPAIEGTGTKVYFARVDERDGAYFTTTSRSLALIAAAGTVEEAERRVERALTFVEGEYHVRHDIGRGLNVRT